MSASELHNLRNSILIDVKSILLSSKDGLTERELCREYKYLNGRDIQYSRLGFNSLYDFLQSLVDESVIYHQRRPPNLIVYFAKEESCTYQLRNLVSGQKDSLAKERDMRRYREASSSYRFNNRFSNRGQTSNSYSTNKGGTVPYYIQCEIKQVLENAKGKPLSRQEFKRNYYQLFPKYIDCEKFGFEDIKELLESLKGLVEVRPCPNDEYTVSLIYESSKAQTTAPLAATTTTTAKSKPIDKENTEAATIGDYAKLNDVMKQGSEIVENLKVLIKSFDDKGGLWARTIPTEYKKLFKKELNVGSIGYRYPIDLLDDKLGDFLQTKRPDKYGDYLIFSKEYQQMCNDGQGNNNDKSNLNGEENGDGEDEIEELNHINNVKQLTKEIRRLFRRDTVNFERNKLYKVNEFTELFETKAGWKLHLKNYGCVTISQLFMKLCDEKLFEFKHENETIYIKYKRENSELTSQVVPTASEYVANYDESSEFMQQKTSSTATSLNGGAGIRVGGKNDSEKVIFMQKFLTEYVFYNETLDPYKVLEDVDLSVECNIIVSHIINPFEMSIQIAKNVPKLNLLMDDLENAYLGVGASHYNMTHEYIQIGKYCAAIFPGDKNWHRCKILEIDDKKKLARVSFIDYGGEAWVSMNELKFLCRRFMNLPQQALLARLSNVDYMNVAGKRWDENVTNYLLKIVQSKVFKAKFDGAVFSLLSCSLYELDSTGKSIYCLNKRIIKDGHATEMKDKSIIRPFERSVLSTYLKSKSQETDNSHAKQLPPKPTPSPLSKRKPVVDANNNSHSVSNKNIIRCSSPIVAVVEDDKIAASSKVRAENNNIKKYDKYQDYDVNESKVNDFDSDSSEEYYFIRPVDKIFSEDRDKEMCIKFFDAIINKFKCDILKLKEAHQQNPTSRSSRIVDEYTEKNDYVRVFESFLNKHLK